jgi:hypothetical protein
MYQVNMNKKEQLREEIEKIKTEIGRLDILRPGTTSQQYTVCGKENCACTDEKNPKKHGPYYRMSYRHDGKYRTEFTKEVDLPQMKKWNKNYRFLDKLIKKWIKLSIELSKLEMKSV